MNPAIPFMPEPKKALKARFASALQPVIEERLVLAGQQEAPGASRRHIFDFEFGVRMIVSTDLNEGQKAVHFSFGKPPESMFDPRALASIGLLLIAEFWHEPVILDIQKTDKCYHIWCKAD